MSVGGWVGRSSTEAPPKGNNFHLIMVSVYNRLPEQMSMTSGRHLLQSKQIRVCLRMQEEEEAGSRPLPAHTHAHI